MPWEKISQQNNIDEIYVTDLNDDEKKTLWRITWTITTKKEGGDNDGRKNSHSRRQGGGH